MHASAGLTSWGKREPFHLPPWQPRPRETCSLPSPMEILEQILRAHFQAAMQDDGALF